MTDLFGEYTPTSNNGKVCLKCGKFRAYRFYYKASARKDGYRSKCKICERKEHKEIHSRKHEIVEGRVCACCGVYKDASQFAKDPTQTFGIHSHCKECTKAARILNKTSEMLVKPKSRKRFVL